MQDPPGDRFRRRIRKQNGHGIKPDREYSLILRRDCLGRLIAEVDLDTFP